jgi:two-component system, cell cycle response regulator DivK
LFWPGTYEGGADMHKKIMIVDDNIEFLDELRETLELSGYELIAVNHSSSAVETAKETKPDVILVDLKMPDKSGFQLANELRQIQEFEDTPIIAMTAFFKDDYVPLMKMCGIKKYLKKPFNPLDVISHIEEVLQEV